MKRLAAFSIKGGVGKTTATVNLARAAATAGVRTLVWDLDPQGAASHVLRIDPELRGGARRLVDRRGELAPHLRATDVVGLDVVPADVSLRHLDLYLDDGRKAARRIDELLAGVEGDYDTVLLDLPAGVSLTTELVVDLTDVLLVPMVPTPMALRTLEQLVVLVTDRRREGGATETRPLIWPFVSMYDWRRPLHRQLLQSLAHSPTPFLATAVPLSSAVERMGTARAPVGSFAPRTAAARAYAALWSEVAARLW